MHTARVLPALSLAALLLAGAAAPPPPPAALEAGLAGRWQGTLGYRDYQSNTLQEIPMQARVEALPDGATIIRISTFDDGPKLGNVFITTASLHDSTAGTVTSAILRRQRPPETITEQARVTAYADPSHWTVETLADGRDDNAPARLRTTTVRDGDVLTATKDVQPAGQGPWLFRNRTRLTRVP
jgi:hypothetical protein